MKSTITSDDVKLELNEYEQERQDLLDSRLSSEMRAISEYNEMRSQFGELSPETKVYLVMRSVTMDCYDYEDDSTTIVRSYPSQVEAERVAAVLQAWYGSENVEYFTQPLEMGGIPIERDEYVKRRVLLL